jgi:hypothetical protein
MNTKKIITAIVAVVAVIGVIILLMNYAGQPGGQNNAPAQGDAVIIENFGNRGSLD